jgi:hypothetical protein
MKGSKRAQTIRNYQCNSIAIKENELVYYNRYEQKQLNKSRINMYNQII